MRANSFFQSHQDGSVDSLGEVLKETVRDGHAKKSGNCVATDFSYLATQRLLSPLRLPFRHIGASALDSKLVVRRAKMNS
jgi:hypothetical protein